MALDGTLLFEEIMQAKEVIHYQAVQYPAYLYEVYLRVMAFFSDGMMDLWKGYRC